MEVTRYYLRFKGLGCLGTCCRHLSGLLSKLLVVKPAFSVLQTYSPPSGVSSSSQVRTNLKWGMKGHRTMLVEKMPI